MKRIFQVVVPDEGVDTCSSPADVQLTVRFIVPPLAVPRFDELLAFPFRDMMEKYTLPVTLELKKPIIELLLGAPASTTTKPLLLFPGPKL